MKPFVVALLAAFFSACVAQDEYKCETPKVWYANAMVLNATEGRPRYGRIYYDEENLRVAFTEENKKAVYYYRETGPVSKTCYSYHLIKPFRPFGPGISDRFDGEFFIGSSDQVKDGVDVDIYSGTTDKGDRFTGAWIPVNTGSCLPVSEMFFEEETKELTIRRFYDIREGIFDFSIFEPPSFCLTPS